MKRIFDISQRLLPLLFDLQAMKAMVTWTEFSISSYGIVSALFKQGIHPQTVIDVGANVGQFTVAALNIFKNVCVHAFEPDKACVVKIKENTTKFIGVHVYDVALGAKHEMADFHLNSYSLASSMLRISNKHRSEFPQVVEKNTVTIEISTLDHFFANSSFLGLVLLKIDVQGYENMVLAGGKETLKKVDYVLLESSFTEMYIGEPLFTDMVDLMRSMDFIFVRPVSFLRSSQNNEILQIDALFKRVDR